MNIDRITVLKKEDLASRRHVGKEPYEYVKYDVVKKRAENRCTVAIYEIPPGKANYPLHYHLAAEEVFYILSGKGVLVTGEGEREVVPGDFVVCPPTGEGAHKLRNPSETKTLVYIDFDAGGFPDIAFYPDSGKVGIVRPGDNTFYRESEAVDYYEGE